jgi:peptide deformylase
MTDTLRDTLRIHLWPHPALRTVCAPVTAAEFSADLAATAQEMLRIIKRPATRGIGLAANQVGITKRFFVMTTATGEDLVCVNPVFWPHGYDKEYATEGCLSVPCVTGQVLRYKNIMASWYTLSGAESSMEMSDIDARCFQHELQHLDGETFFTPFPRQQRRRVEAQWAKARPVALAQGLGI